MSKLQPRDTTTLLVLTLAILIPPAVTFSSMAERVVLQLKSGDRISGAVVSQSTNSVVLSNSWARTLSIPLAEIAKRQTLTNPPAVQVSTNLLVAIKAALKSPPPPVTTNKFWSGDLNLGLDLVYSVKQQQNYHARVKLDYQHPYAPASKHFFRNNFDYSLQYGRTDGEKSTDRMNASDKTSFDFETKWYAYNLASIGYDRIQKIDLQYEEGPGVGYHLFTAPRFSMDTEGGVDYQEQERSSSPNSSEFFYRLAENFKWKIAAPATLTEKFELFPRVDLSELRFRFESTLSYDLWKHLALNFTVLDLYDSQPAVRAKSNELQVHSSLGCKF